MFLTFNSAVDISDGGKVLTEVSAVAPPPPGRRPDTAFACPEVKRCGLNRTSLSNSQFLLQSCTMNSATASYATDLYFYAAITRSSAVCRAPNTVPSLAIRTTAAEDRLTNKPNETNQTQIHPMATSCTDAQRCIHKQFQCCPLVFHCPDMKNWKSIAGVWHLQSVN